MLATATGRSLDTTLALALTGLVVLVIATAFPLVGLDASGTRVSTTLPKIVVRLWTQDHAPVAALVFATTMLAPAAELSAIIVLLTTIRRHVGADGEEMPAYVARLLRTVQFVRYWSMLDVFMLGTLVSMVKLHGFAEVSWGPSLFAVGSLMLILAKITTTFDPHAVWLAIAGNGALRAGPTQVLPRRDDRIEQRAGPPIAATAGSTPDRSVGIRTALQSGLAACETCALLTMAAPGRANDAASVPAARCPRCGSALHQRKVASLTRTWAFLITAAVLAVPANLLPITHSKSLFGDQSDTIFSGVVYFFRSGSWGIASIVLVASIVVPLLKLGILATLLWSVQHANQQRAMRNARLYRFVEFIGRWSMLDVFVVALLTAVVQLGGLATIDAGPAVLAFAVMCVLTILASRAFDPRLMWDTFDRPLPLASR